MSIDGRRAFLKKLGIAAPASLIGGAEYGAGTPAPATAMSAEEVFTTFLSEAMHQAEMRGLATDSRSTTRVIFEIQAAALALVLSHMQQRADPEG